MLNSVFPAGLQPLPPWGGKGDVNVPFPKGTSLLCGVKGASDPHGCVWGIIPRAGSWLLPWSRSWMFSLCPCPVYPGSGHSLEEGAEECGAGICLIQSYSAHFKLRGWFYLFITGVFLRAPNARLQPELTGESKLPTLQYLIGPKYAS